jgi:cation:H+ antiporter
LAHFPDDPSPMRWANDGRGATLAIFALAGVALYAASRTAAGALAGHGHGHGHGHGRPGWRGVGHWLPIAATALVAAALGRPDIAVPLAFATSIASLAFVLGVLSYLSPMDHLPPTRRAWPFVLPAALLALIAGFSGQLTWLHALAMLLLGGALLSVWRDPGLAGPDDPSLPFAEEANGPASRPRWLRVAEVLLALALAAVGGWAAVVGTTRAAEATRVFSNGLVTVAIVAPLVTLPMLNPGPTEQARAHTASMASTVVAVALLNLCALLPLLVLFWHVKTGVAGPEGAAASWFPFSAILQNGQPLSYPLATWRVDAVVLVVLGFAMLPVSLGRWQLGRWEGAGLILGYAMYLILEAAVTVRL